ncbi:hypothetical protein G7Y89_g13552 [Cudoniella acicularis]|uniref:Uncharacterized protein n=1 Tax=Cudoniella acicularis TaxID=354080 RepID=A0A8H4R8B6_9HELO|nr:hypothetical protein G7Y89_g13552 [Cudoniella acicularis]
MEFLKSKTRLNGASLRDHDSNYVNIACSTVLILFGFTCAILIMVTEYLLRGYYGKGTYHPDMFVSVYDMTYIPKNFNTRPNSIIKSAGLLAAAAGGLYIFLLQSKTGYVMRSRITIGLGLTATIYSLFSLLYSEIVNYQSNREWHYTDVFSSTSGNYTVEGWTCIMQNNLPRAKNDFWDICLLSFLAIAIYPSTSRMAPPYLTTAAIATTSLFLFALGIATIAITADAQVTIGTLYGDFEGTGWSNVWRRNTWNYNPEGGNWLSGPEYSVLVAGIFAVMVGISGSLLICTSNFCIGMTALFFGGASSITSLIALAYSMASFYGTTNTRSSYGGSAEKWACSQKAAGEDGVKFSKICVESCGTAVEVTSPVEPAVELAAEAAVEAAVETAVKPAVVTPDSPVHH